MDNPTPLHERGRFLVDPDSPTWVVEEGAGVQGSLGLVAAAESPQDARIIAGALERARTDAITQEWLARSR